jgi:2'-5' RNA ligase
MRASALESVRSFIAITLAPEIAEKLKEIQSELRSKLPDNAVRWVKPERLHLTLKFLGNVSCGKLDDLIAATNRACDGTGPFRLTLEGVGCFPNTKEPRVIWIGVNGELKSLRTLRKRFEEETENIAERDEARGFQPHLTIGRVKALGQGACQVGESVERAIIPAPGGWVVRQVELMQSELSSEGARYQTMISVKLAD